MSGRPPRTSYANFSSTTTGKSATTVKRKAARRTRILSEAPDPEGVEGPGAEAVETAVAVEDADDDDGRAKNECAIAPSFHSDADRLQVCRRRGG